MTRKSYLEENLDAFSENLFQTFVSIQFDNDALSDFIIRI